MRPSAVVSSLPTPYYGTGTCLHYYTAKNSRLISGFKTRFTDNTLIYTIISGIVIEILCIAITCIGDIKQNIPGFAFLYTGSFIVYIFTASYTLKKTSDSRNQPSDKVESSHKALLWTILAFSVIFRLTLIPAIPSDDIYRYLWEGKLQLNFINPYSFAPESRGLEHLRDEFYSGINHKNLATIYPPLTLIMFAIADFISHSIISMKSIFLFFDILIIFILVRFLRESGRNPVNVLIYAWSPLVLISFAARGHCDSLQIFFVILALYFYSRQKNLSSITSITLAVAAKITSVIIVPFLLLKNKPGYIIVLFLITILLYLPYINASEGLFYTLLHFGSQYHFNDSVHFVIFYLTPGSKQWASIITTAVFGIVLLYLYKKYFNIKSLLPDSNVLRFPFIAIGAFLILSPTVHPWYLTWIVPFLCFYRSKAWIILTGTVVFYYFMNHELFSSMIEYNNEWVWKEVHWLKLPEYLPFYGLLIYEFIKKKKGK